jgi:hypothetical protein
MILKSIFVRKFESRKSLNDETDINKVYEGLMIAVVIYFAGIVTGFMLAYTITKGIC